MPGISWLSERVRDQAQHPGDLDGVAGLVRLLVGKPKT